jgi:MFS family permease
VTAPIADAASSPPTPAPDWQRAFVVQLVVAFLNVTAVHASRPTVTYRALELGGTTLDIGLIQSAFSILPTLTAVAIGRWVDRTGERGYLAVAMAVMCLASLIAAYAGDLLTLAVSQLVLGMGQILFLVAGQSLVANYGQRDGREVRFGHYATAHSFGQLVGPALAAIVIGGGMVAATGPLAALVPATTPGLSFLVTAALTGGAFMAALLLPRPRRRAGDGQAQRQPSMVDMTRQVLRRRGMPAAMVVSIIVASSVDMVIAYLPVYGEEAGLSVALVGMLLTVRGIAALISRLFMTQLIALLTRERTLALSMALSGVGLLAIPFVTTDWLLVVLMICAGLGLGLGQPMTISWVATRSPRSERATALGVRITGNRASLLVIPPALGALAGAAGVAAIFVVLAGSLVGGAVVASATPFDELAENRDRPGRPAEPQPPGGPGQ